MFLFVDEGKNKSLSPRLEILHLCKGSYSTENVDMLLQRNIIRVT